MRNEYEMITVKEYVHNLTENELYVVTTVENFLNNLKDETTTVRLAS